jgi:hypothetical protein
VLLALPALLRPRHILLALAALCASAAMAAPALADYHDVISECYNTGQLPPGKYSRHDLKQARNHLPSDIKEYSDCENLINAALAAGNRKNGGTGGGGGYNPPPSPALTTPSGAIASSQQALDDLNNATDPKNRSSVPPQVAIAGSKMSPSTGGVINAAKRTDANSLPLPLILSLAALAAMAALAAATVLRQRWPQIRRAPLRLLGR